MASEIDALFGQLSRPQTPDISDPQPTGWVHGSNIPFVPLGIISGPTTAPTALGGVTNAGDAKMFPVYVPAPILVRQLVWYVATSGAQRVAYEWVLARDFGAGHSPVVVAYHAADLGTLNTPVTSVVETLDAPVQLAPGLHWWVQRSTETGTWWIGAYQTPVSACRARLGQGPLPGAGNPVDLSAYAGGNAFTPAGWLVGDALDFGAPL